MKQETPQFGPPQTPLLIVISGPSGVGKDSVLQRMKEHGLPFHFVVTATTREEELVERLKKRKTEKAEDLKLRIAPSRQEFKRIVEFDYVVVNKEDKLDETVEVINDIIQAEHHRVEPRRVSL